MSQWESSPPIYKLHAPSSFGLGQTSNFFTTRTKLSKLRSWKARRLTQLSSSELVWIVQNVLFVCFRGITSEYRLRDKCGSSHATNWTNKLKICLMYINLVREKIYHWFDSVDWFDASKVRRLTQQTILTEIRSTQNRVWFILWKVRR